MLYLFEGYALDTALRELRRGATLVSIEPKVFDLLSYLIENRERVVSRDDLIASIWQGRIVSESALARCLNGARSAIGDSGEVQALIKTFQRKGVRFVGTVHKGQQPLGFVAAGEPAPLLEPRKPPIAVLPFANLTGDHKEDYLSDGITEDVIVDLSRFSELVVIARNSSFQYKGKTADARQIGRELGVEYVLEGSVRRADSRVRISVQLVDAVTGKQRWAERYDRKLEDVFAVQEEVARTVAALLVAHVSRAEIERALTKSPASWQAYEYYLRAAHTYASFWSSFKATEVYEVRRLLAQSLSIDPNNARAHTMLAWTHCTMWLNALDSDYLNPAALDRAYEMASRAVQLDPHLPQAHAELGRILVRKRDHDAAVGELERAIALNPNFTDWRFAEVFVYAGDSGRAIEELKRHMRLDPFYAPLAPGWLGFAHHMLQKYSQAVPLLRECVARAPNLRSGHAWLAVTYAELGKIQEARAEAAEVLRIEPSWTIEGVQARLSTFKDPQAAQQFFSGLEKAGLPRR
jgi:adenylate cyclase